MDCLPTHVSTSDFQMYWPRIYSPSLSVCHCALVCVHYCVCIYYGIPKKMVDMSLRVEAGKCRSNRDLHTVSLPQQHVTGTHSGRAWKFPFTNTMSLFACYCAMLASMLNCLGNSQQVRSFVLSSYLSVSPCPALAFLMIRWQGCQGALPKSAWRHLAVMWPWDLGLRLLKWGCPQLYWGPSNTHPGVSCWMRLPSKSHPARDPRVCIAG